MNIKQIKPKRMFLEKGQVKDLKRRVFRLPKNIDKKIDKAVKKAGLSANKWGTEFFDKNLE